APALPPAAAAAPAPAPPSAALPSLAALGISPTRAVLVTPLFPGWGQLYAGAGWRAALSFGAETIYWTQLIKNDRKAVRWRTMEKSVDPVNTPRIRDFYTAQGAEYRALVRDFAWWSLGALLIIALDAYVDANLYGFDEDPVPVPDHWDALPGSATPAPTPDADFAVTLFRAGF
ncbi:MAG: DUF5683 domain-containing protein, partial [Candidatus Krumholzibacteriia bacterium]